MYANPVLHFNNSEDSIKCVSAYDLRYDYGGMNASKTLWINWIIAAHICAGEITSLVLGDIFKYIGLYFSFTEVCFQWSHWWPTDPSIPYTMMTSSNGNIFRVTDPLCGELNSPHKGQWRGALMFSLISAWINCWVNNSEAGDLRRNHAHYDVIVIQRADYTERGFISYHHVCTPMP